MVSKKITREALQPINKVRLVNRPKRNTGRRSERLVNDRSSSATTKVVKAMVRALVKSNLCKANQNTPRTAMTIARP